MEWAYLRHICKRYGFGRHQLQPMRKNAEALGFYLGDYLKKDWNHRLPEDKGARCIRYFGHWLKEPRQQGERRVTPRSASMRGWTRPRARAWREMLKQLATVLAYKGTKINEHNVQDILGPKWAWKMGRLFPAVRFIAGEWLDAEIREVIEEHNQDVRKRWLEGGGDPAHECWWDITEITLDHLRPSPAWQKQMADLQLAKECEAEIKRRIKARKTKKAVKVPVSVETQQPVPFPAKQSWASWIEQTAKED